jgi:hypothetical protein
VDALSLCSDCVKVGSAVVSALGCSDNGALSLEILEIPSLKESDQVLNNLGTALSQASCS